MAKKVNPQKIRRQISSELKKFSQCLKRVVGVIDTTSLDNAATNCLGNIPNGEKDAWGYDLNNMTFNFKVPRKTLPHAVKGYLNLELNVSVYGSCTAPIVGDPFTALNVDIEISQKWPGTERKSISAWHFDRHIVDPGDNLPEEIHPLYHFHHGGRRMHSIENYGDILLLSAPRLHHPPMDAILAVDFVLANFLPGEWRKLQDDGMYRNILKEVQNRYWLPYLLSLAGKPPEINPQQTIVSPYDLCPTMVMH